MFLKNNIQQVAFCLVCLLLPALWGIQNVNAQVERFNFSAGVVVHIPYYKQLNTIIDKYNATRTQLVQPMRRISAAQGFAFSVGTNDWKNIYSLSFGQTRVGSQGVDSVQGYTETSELSIRARYFTFNYSGLVKQHRRWGFFLGGGFKAGGEAMFSRRYRSIDPTVPPLVNLNSTDLLIGFEFSPQVHYNLDKTGNFRIVLRPFAYAELLEDYYSDVYKALNPKDFESSDFNTAYGYPHGIGLELKCLVIF